jgi:hypothetical protein
MSLHLTALSTRLAENQLHGPQSLAVQTADGFTDMVNIFVSGPD